MRDSMTTHYICGKRRREKVFGSTFSICGEGKRLSGTAPYTRGKMERIRETTPVSAEDKSISARTPHMSGKREVIRLTTHGQENAVLKRHTCQTIRPVNS